MLTSGISILSLMSKWGFIPNVFSLYIFAFQLRLYRKQLTWSNGYLEVIFHALDVFSIIFATSYVEVKNRHSHRRRIVCFGYGHVLPEVQKSSKQKSKTIKVIYLLSIQQLIVYSAQLNPWLFWYEIILITYKAKEIDNQLFTFNWPAVIALIVNIIRYIWLKPTNTWGRHLTLMTEHCLTAFFDVNNNQMTDVLEKLCEVDKCVSQTDLRKQCSRQALIMHFFLECIHSVLWATFLSVFHTHTHKYATSVCRECLS